MIDGLDAAVAKLRASADSLNALTDKIGRSVADVENFLNKVCSAGVYASVNVENRALDNGLSEYTCLTYQRVGGRYRIAVESGREDFPEDVFLKPWAECSRDIKLDTAKVLPALVLELATQIDERIAVATETDGIATSVVTVLNKSKEG